VEKNALGRSERRVDTKGSACAVLTACHNLSVCPCYLLPSSAPGGGRKRSPPNPTTDNLKRTFYRYKKFIGRGHPKASLARLYATPILTPQPLRRAEGVAPYKKDGICRGAHCAPAPAPTAAATQKEGTTHV